MNALLAWIITVLSSLGFVEPPAEIDPTPISNSTPPVEERSDSDEDDLTLDAWKNPDHLTDIYNGF